MTEHTTDRGLMVLAAKAAKLKNYDYVGAGMREQAVHGVPSCGHTGPIWDPLTDDGDALRLAVKLGICIHTRDRYSDGYPPASWAAKDDYSIPLWAEHRDDPLAATRRAIVRTAAEIGRAMQ